MIDFKALKGDSTDNIPGFPGSATRRRRSCIQATATLEGVRALDKVKPEQLRTVLARAARRACCLPRTGHDRPGLPVELDLTAARLGDYDRDEVVRLFREYEFRTLVERLPSLAGEARRGPATAARGGPLGPGAGGLGRGASPAARDRPRSLLAGRRPGFSWPRLRCGRRCRRRRAAPADRGRRGRSGLAAGARLRPRPRSGRRSSSRATGASAPLPSGDLRAALAAAHRDPVDVEPCGRRVPVLAAWLAGQLGGSASASCSTIRGHGGARPGARGRRRGRPGRRRRRTPRRPGAGAARSRPPAGRSSGTRSSRSSSPARRRSRTRRPRRVAFDTQIAAYILNASLRSQSIGTSWPSGSTWCCRRPGGPPPRPEPASRRSPPLAVTQALAARLAESDARPLFEELELPLIPVLARMEAAGVAIDRAALGDLTGVRGRDRPAGAGDLRRTWATSSRSAAPSSSSRSCSTSSTCRAGSARRPASRRTRRCSRTSARPPDGRQAARLAHVHQAR